MNTTASDMVHEYRLVPDDFVKHLMTTLVVVVVVVLAAAIAFGVPEAQPLTIRGYATAHPVQFEQVVLRALDGQGQIANYGPPYNHGTGSVQSPLQVAVGILHPVNAAQDFVLKPLAMAASINPGIRPVLRRFEAAAPTVQRRWEAALTVGLEKAHAVGGRVLLPPGHYGPVAAMLADALDLGRSGLMSGALTRNPAVITHFDNQNELLFLQGAPLQTDPATQAMQGANWGIIHPAVAGYPGAWWMTVPTWIYQWPFVANSNTPDALALSIGFLFWLALALTPWIPGWNRVPRLVKVYRLIWKGYYADRRSPSTPGARETRGGHVA
jgi:hypothetical protein